LLATFNQLKVANLWEAKGKIVVINYSDYTLDELFDVHENIDRDKYPQRYTKLCEEIQRRKETGEFQQSNPEAVEPDDDDEDENEFIIEFSSDGNKTIRKVFVLGFILINIVVLAFILPQYIVTDLVNIHEYSTEIDFIECAKEEVINDDTDEIHTFFDLNIGAYQDSFSAIGIGEAKCKTLASYLKIGTNVSIWHEDGLIHQLKSKDKILLPYIYMKDRVRDLRTDKAIFYWFGLAFFWAILFKSLVNAVVPGTFISNK